MIHFWYTFLVSFIPAAVFVLGGMIPYKFPITPRMSSSLQHFVSGILIAAVGVELLPTILQTDAPISTSIGFILGVVLILGLHPLLGWISRRQSKKPEEPESQEGEKATAQPGAAFQQEPEPVHEVNEDEPVAVRPTPPLEEEAASEIPVVPIGAMVAIAIDLFVDGFLIGISFLAGPDSGTVIALSLSFCALFLALTLGEMMHQSGLSLKRRTVFLAFQAAMLPIGAIVAYIFAGKVFATLDIEILAFGIAALLSIGIEQLLGRAHTIKDRAWTPALFFLGFWCVLMLKML